MDEKFSELRMYGKQVELRGITIHRFEDGKIVEEWEAYDNLSMLQQLELAPEQ